MARYLDAVLASHRARYALDGREEGELRRRAFDAVAASPRRDFASAISSPGLSLIAEIKRRSPSRGDLDPALDPAETAVAYEEGGASCLSVLTDGPHFAGSPEDLVAARAAVAIPVLRKDFTLGRRDVYDACCMGADAVLLIAAALGTEELHDLSGVAQELEMAAVVEVHDEDEAARARESGAHIVGVNQRDLGSFAVDPARAVRVRRALDRSVLTVAESGITRPSDLAPLADAGFDAVLVGEALVRADDRREAAAAFSNYLRTGVRPCG